MGRIVFFIARYSITGVPLAQLRLASAFSRRGYQVDFVVGYVPEGLEVPDVAGVRVINFNTSRVYKLFFLIVDFLKKNQPTVVFSAEDHLNAVVLGAAIFGRSKAKISCSSRVTPYQTYLKSSFKKSFVLKSIIRMVMWRADVLTCVSQGTVDEYRDLFGSSRHVCVYNIIDRVLSESKINEFVDHPWIATKTHPVIVAAGSLGPWKGYSNLIRAAKLLAEKVDFRLLVLGDGPSRKELQELIDDLRISDVVELLGHVENPLKYFAKADVFAHSALSESFGNVLVEAMICGSTVVSTDCPTGPREILGNGKYGYLVPINNPKALADCIEFALNNPIDPELLKEAVLRFDEDEIMRKHAELLKL